MTNFKVTLDHVPLWRMNFELHHSKLPEVMIQASLLHTILDYLLLSSVSDSLFCQLPPALINIAPKLVG